MNRYGILLVAVTMIAIPLAGCISGEDAPAASPAEEDTAEQAAPTAETGSVTGKVVTKDLDEVAEAPVALTDGQGAIVADKKTDKTGRFTFNDLAPGIYRVQVTALCCKAAVESVEVQAGDVTEVNMQLEVLTKDDLQQPHVEENEWKGFISCGARAGVPGVRTLGIALCAVPGAIDESIADPNEDFIHYFNMSKGLKTLYVAMDWEPVGGVSGGDLNLLVEQGICNEVACADAYRYADLDGPPALVARIDAEDVEREDAKFENITETAEFKFRIFAGEDYANLIYQQPFTVYWYEFYWEPAPEDFNPLPDG